MLESADLSQTWRPELGWVILRLNQLLGGIESQRFVMSESYFWVGNGSLHVARVLPTDDAVVYVRDPGARESVVYFSGVLLGRGLELIAEPSDDGDEGFLTAGTVLRFEMAPEDPITDEWWETFDPGPPYVTKLSAPGLSADEKAKFLMEFIAEETEAGRRRGQERLRRAWRAPA